MGWVNKSSMHKLLKSVYIDSSKAVIWYLFNNLPLCLKIKDM